MPVYILSNYPGSTTRIPFNTRRIRGVFNYGQSNSVWGGLGGGHPSVCITSVVDQYRAFMVNTGYMGTQATETNQAEIVDFIPGMEKWAKKGEKGTVGGSSFLRKVLRDQDSIGLPEDVWVVRCTGESGQRISRLGEGWVPMTNTIATVSSMKEISETQYGMGFDVPFIRFAQGEADAAEETPKETYKTSLKTLVSYTNRAIKQKTRQQRETYFGLDILVAPDGTNRNITDITIAQVEILDDASIPVVPNCSPYWFSASVGFISGQTVHWSANGKDHLVEFAARAMRICNEAPFGARLGDTINRYVYNPNLTTSPWELKEVPFETSPRANLTSFQRSANKITFTVPYAEGGLSKYEGYRGAATNDGFKWSGPEVYQGVSISGGETNVGVEVFFTSDVSTAGGLLTYAVEPQENTQDSAPDCFGSLFDNCQEPSYAKPGRTLRQGLLPFSVSVV